MRNTPSVAASLTRGYTWQVYGGSSSLHSGMKCTGNIQLTLKIQGENGNRQVNCSHVIHMYTHYPVPHITWIKPIKLQKFCFSFYLNFDILRFPKKGPVLLEKFCLKKKYGKIWFRDFNMFIKWKKISFWFKDLEPTLLFLRRIIKLIRQRINLASGIWSSSADSFHSPLVW